MIRRIFLILLSLALFVEPGLCENGSDLYTSAQRDYIAGRLDEAKAKFQKMLQEDPRDTRAQNYLRMIEASGRKDNGAMLERKLSSVILPRVEFKNATFQSCVDFLKQDIEKQSEGKVVPNFVLKISPEKSEEPVTLSLRNIPAAEAIKYLGELVSLKFSYQKHAIVVSSPSGAVPPVSKSGE